MSIETRRRIVVGGIPVEVVRKDIKNLHLAVYPPNGRVRVATPQLVSIEAARLAVITRLPWVKKQRARYRDQERLARPEFITGESHYYLGRRYRLSVIETKGTSTVRVRGNERLELRVSPRTTRREREQILTAWYRSELNLVALKLLKKWRARMKIEMPVYGIKRMKTKWGSYGRRTHQVWFNLELIKKPQRCIEYIVVHELVHAIVPNHGDRFQMLMKKHLPNWEFLKRDLNRGPLGHEGWEY